MLLFIISFIAGVLTSLAPCTLPLLPVIVGSSITGEFNRKKALTIALSLGFSVVAFTLLLKVSTFFISIPQVTWAIISGVIIITFGLFSLFPDLWERIPFVASLASKSNQTLSLGYGKKSIWGDIIIGASLGPVFSTCSPTYFVILATVLPQSLALGLLDLFAYAIGLSGMLFLIAFLGQKIVSRLEGLSDTHGVFRRSLGAFFVLIGILIMFGVDKQAELGLLNSGLFDITRLEQPLLGLISKSNGGFLETDSTTTGTTTQDQNKSTSNIVTTHGPKAPEIMNPSGFVNTDGKPITIAQFKGKKVILLDVWTYSCINCQRTLPYVEGWYEKYKDQGLVVIGLHTPEFSFEKVQSNVESAVKRFNLTYPVVLDNDYSTWTAYGNQYWPRKYLINENGEIIYDHIGEGNYDETEKEIQKALSELNNKKIDAPITNPTPTSVAAGSPETYFGSNRNQYLGNGTQGVTGKQDLKEPSSFDLNTLYLNGTWNIFPEYAETLQTTIPSKIDYKYQSKSVYFVAGADHAITAEVLRDGLPIDSKVKGKDIFYKDGKSYVQVLENRLYSLVEDAVPGSHTLELIIPDSGLQAFTFTFG